MNIVNLMQSTIPDVVKRSTRFCRELVGRNAFIRTFFSSITKLDRNIASIRLIGYRGSRFGRKCWKVDGRR